MPEDCSLRQTKAERSLQITRDRLGLRFLSEFCPNSRPTEADLAVRRPTAAKRRTKKKAQFLGPHRDLLVAARGFEPRREPRGGLKTSRRPDANGVRRWSGREDSNLRPLGPEPTRTLHFLGAKSPIGDSSVRILSESARTRAGFSLATPATAIALEEQELAPLPAIVVAGGRRCRFGAIQSTAAVRPARCSRRVASEVRPVTDTLRLVAC
jgi:hypothetical protein